jgi:starch synthase
LADTIIDANEAALSAGVATGFQFAPNNGGAMLHAIQRLVEQHARPAVWASIQRQGMKADVSWDKSAEKYVELYRLLLSKRAA